MNDSTRRHIKSRDKHFITYQSWKKYAPLSDHKSRRSGWPKFQPNSPKGEDLHKIYAAKKNIQRLAFAGFSITLSCTRRQRHLLSFSLVEIIVQKVVIIITYQILKLMQCCCGSRMFIPDPGSWFLPITDPGSRILDPGSKNSNERQGWKKICCHNFFWSHKFHKI